MPSQRHIFSALILLLLAPVAHAGPFAPAAGQPGSTAIWMGDSSISGWADGYIDYTPGSAVDPEWQTPNLALGPALGDAFDIVSLGRGGRITLTFDTPIANGAGADFAVFENSFSDTFLELAWVEVSSNGATFVRFPGFSFTALPVGPFGGLDPTDIDGFAGKYRQGWGTPFDLDLFASVDPAILDVNAVTHVRIIDIVGDGSVFDNWPSQFGGPNPIYDPYATTGSAGFDLDAIAVINQGTPPPPPPSTNEQVPFPPGALALLSIFIFLIQTHIRPHQKVKETS
ncbi:MAG: PEP-CTERM sorting domain-containing protein [Pseudomonadota bacterium]